MRSVKEPATIGTFKFFILLIGGIFLTLYAIFGTLFYVFNHESEEDLAFKEELLPILVERTTKYCNFEHALTSSNDYIDVMTQVLRSIKADTLSHIHDNGFTVCFDGRLVNLSPIVRKSWIFTYTESVNNAYYPKTKTITILDDDRMNTKRKLISSAKSNWPYQQIEKLAEQLNEGYMTRGKVYIGVRYNRGKSSVTTHRSYKKFDNFKINNPELFQPPLL